jgi:putative salt-induced outer membrane protein YdiY
MVIWFLAAAPAWAVVDIAPEEVGIKPGLSGNVAISYSTESGNTDKDEGDASGKIKYDINSNSLAFIQGVYARSKSSDVKTEDEILTHARYLHRLKGEDLYGEGFIQTYENEFKGIANRWLSGGNLRWRFLSDSDFGKFYVGGGAFQEQVNYTDDYPNEDGTLLRMNSYLAYTQKFTEWTEFSMTGYYQPAVRETGDYVTSLSAEFILHVVSGLSLSLTYEIDRDSRPPDGIEELDSEIKTSLVWKF